MLAAAGALTALFVAVAGCSFTVDDGEPALPLVGAPLALEGRPTVVRRAGEQLRVLPGDDGAPWAAIFQVLDIGHQVTDLRLVRLAAPQSELRFDRSAVWLGSRVVYELVLPPVDGPGSDAPAQLRVIAPGAPSPSLTLGLPQRNAVGGIVPLAGDRAFGIVPGDSGLDGAVVHVATGRARAVRGIALLGGNLWVDGAARRLYTVEEDVIVSRGLADDEPRRALAPVEADAELRFDPDRERALACGPAGLALYEGESPARRLLTDATCATVLRVSDDGWVWFRPTVGGPIAGVPLDGAAPARIVSDKAARLLAARGDRAVTATTPPDAWRGSASDGWIEARRVMERGRAIDFSSDGASLLWLEHTANDSTTGALLRAPADGSAPPRTLERNAFRWAALPDGRLVAAAHRVEVGPHNRIDLVDADARARHPLAVGASDFVLLADARALLVQRVGLDDEEREELVLLPIPEQTR